MKDSARYVKIVEWSDEDGCYVGSAPGLVMAGCHGADEMAVFAELCEIVEAPSRFIRLMPNRCHPPRRVGTWRTCYWTSYSSNQVPAYQRVVRVPVTPPRPAPYITAFKTAQPASSPSSSQCRNQRPSCVGSRKAGLSASVAQASAIEAPLASSSMN